MAGEQNPSPSYPKKIMTSHRSTATSSVTTQSFFHRHGFIWIIWGILVSYGWYQRSGAWLRGELFGNDDYMRLVQIRDWLDGQSWLDLHQYRLNPVDPVYSHWSRISDVLIGLPIRGMAPFVGQETAELVMLAAYPILMLLILLYLIFIIARRIDANLVTNFSIGFMTLSSIAVAAPFNLTRIDHHGLQMVIALTTCWCILKSAESPKKAIYAGVLCGIGLYVGIESAPFVAAACAAVSLIWVFNEPSAGRRLRYFGSSLAASTLLCLAISTDPSRWLLPHCDALSLVYVALAAMVGTTFWLLSFSGRLIKSKPGRLGLAGGLGVGCLIITIILFPNCLKGPYSDVDPVLVELWLSNVGEAGSFPDYISQHVSSGLAVISVPVMALIGYWIYHRKNGTGLSLIPRTIIIFMLASLIIGFLQIRAMAIAASFAIPFAAYLLATALDWARKYKNALLRVLVQTSLVILISPVAISLIVGTSFFRTEKVQSPTVALSDRCTDPTVLETLNQLPLGTALTQINLGAPILKHTEFSVTSAPYHRNTKGIRSAFEMFIGDEQTALKAVRRSRADYVMACRNASETDRLIEHSPTGMLAQMLAGEAPDWLEEIDIGQGDNLLIFRVID